MSRLVKKLHLSPRSCWNCGAFIELGVLCWDCVRAMMIAAATTGGVALATFLWRG